MRELHQKCNYLSGRLAAGSPDKGSREDPIPIEMEQSLDICLQIRNEPCIRFGDNISVFKSSNMAFLVSKDNTTFSRILGIQPFLYLHSIINHTPHLSPNQQKHPYAISRQNFIPDAMSLPTRKWGGSFGRCYHNSITAFAGLRGTR
ncbi:hypothetical protein BHAP_0643 [Bifidobacterium hapali]|uniref:Uncharacterized protein n=1 Tax=Bifidobacterium hapali TaxID=1630172 RepID=A0A261G292_9BIFI|nr:hypothetical protein BHAP_0643 [Bifidobacterium hapali]